MRNSFQGGRFDKFPFLQKLIIWNPELLKNEQHHSSTLITFNHLFELNVMYAHSDYVIQFVCERNTRLPCLTNLQIDYKTLATVTKNFTNDATRLNLVNHNKLRTITKLSVTI
jgi:hypothetical protein